MGACKFLGRGGQAGPVPGHKSGGHCLSQVDNWVLEASKNGQLYEIGYGTSGLTGSAMSVTLDGSEIIATPALIPTITGGCQSVYGELRGGRSNDRGEPLQCRSVNQWRSERFFGNTRWVGPLFHARKLSWRRSFRS